MQHHGSRPFLKTQVWERLESRARELASHTLGMCVEVREDEDGEGGDVEGGMEACLAQRSTPEPAFVQWAGRRECPLIALSSCCKSPQC